MKGFSLMNWSEIQGYTVAQDIRFQIIKYGWKNNI